jgi:hypothetical protein
VCGVCCSMSVSSFQILSARLAWSDGEADVRGRECAPRSGRKDGFRAAAAV